MRIVKQHPIVFFLGAAFIITYPLGIGAFLSIRAVSRATGLDLRWAAELSCSRPSPNARTFSQPSTGGSPRSGAFLPPSS